MHCPFCGAADTRVVDSRLAEDGGQVRRRRECPACGERFTTFERAELTLPRVVKRDGKREPFNEDKLRGGLLRALEKRPVQAEAVEAALGRILRLVRASGEREVAARRIGEWVMAELRDLDQVAYVRFASVYRSFQDVNAFREEVERLQEAVAPAAATPQMSLLPETNKSAAGEGTP